MNELRVEPQGVIDRPSRTAAIDGVRLHRFAPFVDHRGSLTELIDVRKPFWEEPVVYAYRITVGRGRIKGWGMHRRQADRYVILDGLLRVALYDGREGSPSFQSLEVHHFGTGVPGGLRIPPGVWHGVQNLGETEASVLNFPTVAFDRDDPDKARIDPHGGEIPFDWSPPDF